MDGSRFDTLTRSLVSRGTRRGFLAGVLGLGAGLTGISAAAACPPGQVSKRSQCICKKTGRPPVNGACPCPKGLSDLGDGEGCRACHAEGDCPTGLGCTGGQCVCTPTSCPTGCCDGGGHCRIDNNAACGTAGETCVVCPSPNTCGGGGTPGVCGCTDNGPVCGSAICGTAINNCGQPVACGPLGGACPDGQECLGGACVCTGASCPTGCCDGGGQCRIDDDAACGTAGGTCVVCTDLDTCGGGGTPGVCGCTPSGGPCGILDNGCCSGICCFAGSQCPDHPICL